MKKRNINKKNTKMKEAAIETIFVWMIVFASFISVFFMVINYSVVIRVKDHVDTLADYGANYVATNGIGDDISNLLDNMSPPKIQSISANTNDICTSVADNTFQVIFNVTTSNDSLLFHEGAISSTRVAYNQANSNTITCNLSITLND